MRQKNEKMNRFIGEKIKCYRQDLGMTQSDLGKKIGISYQQIQKYEKGNNSISFVKIIYIANFLNRDITDFVPNRGVKKEIEPFDKKIYSIVRDLRKLTIKSLLAISILAKGLKKKEVKDA